MSYRLSALLRETHLTENTHKARNRHKNEKRWNLRLVYLSSTLASTILLFPFSTISTFHTLDDASGS